MLQVFFELTPNVYTEMQVVRFAGWAVGTATEVGQADTGKIPFDDPGGTLDIVGWRKVRIYETEAAEPLLWSGRIMAREVKRGDSERGSLRTGADRWWDCDAIDQNVLLGARHFTVSSANRPAESVGERLTWLLGTTALLPTDQGHVTYPTNRMDAADYRLQSPADVLSDCAQVVGYNFFAIQLDDDDLPELFFMDPDSADWASTLRISDYPGDVDSLVTFAPSYDASLRRSPEDVASKVIVPYNGSSSLAFVSVDDSAIGDQFAYVDKLAPQANVKTAAKATVIANRLLATSATESDRVTCSIDVPASAASDLRPFHLVQYRSQWAPGYSDWTWMRLVRWSITQNTHAQYTITVEMVPQGAVPDVCSVESWNYTNGQLDGTVQTTNTPTGSYPPNTYYGLTGNDFVYGIPEGLSRYRSAGGGGFMARPYPAPAAYAAGLGGGWHFRDYSVADGSMPFGIKDGGMCIAGPEKMNILVVGPGEMTVWGTSIDTATWILYGVEIVDPFDSDLDEYTELDTGAMSFPSTTFTVPDSGYCLYSVVIRDASPDNLGSSFYYGGFDWVAG